MRNYKIQFSQFNPTKIVYQFDSILSHTKIWFSALWTIFKIGLGANFQPRFLTGRHCETIPIGRAHLYCHGPWFPRFNFLLGQKVRFHFAQEKISVFVYENGVRRRGTDPKSNLHSKKRHLHPSRHLWVCNNERSIYSLLSGLWVLWSQDHMWNSVNQSCRRISWLLTLGTSNKTFTTPKRKAMCAHCLD